MTAAWAMVVIQVAPTRASARNSHMATSLEPPSALEPSSSNSAGPAMTPNTTIAATPPMTGSATSSRSRLSTRHDDFARFQAFLIRSTSVDRTTWAARASQSDDSGLYFGRRRASHDVRISAFDYRTAAAYWVSTSRRPIYRLADPIIRFHHVVTRRDLARFEDRRFAAAWADARPRFSTHVLGPHFERRARDFTGAAVVNDERARAQHGAHGPVDQPEWQDHPR